MKQIKKLIDSYKDMQEFIEYKNKMSKEIFNENGNELITKGEYSMKQNEFAKVLNCLVTGDKFDNKDTDNYIYASLSQPPIKIISKNDSNDELDYTVECPNCGSHVNYGTQIYMLSGHIYCSEGDCREMLEDKLTGF